MKWEKEHPDDEFLVLAEVQTKYSGVAYRVLWWHASEAVWVLEGDQNMSRDDLVVRWTKLADITAPKPDKRVPEITAVVELLKALNNGHLDDESMARKGAKTLILKMRKLYPVYVDIMPLMERFLTRVKQHEFHGPAATSFAYLNRYHLRLINELENAKASARQQRSSDKFAAGVEALARQGQ